jgi:uncharacterized membrane protein YjfL (UPF0719 family)
MNGGARWVYGVCFAASLLMIAVVLSLWGAAEIRADGGEILFLTGAGAAWLGIASILFSWLGLSLRDDAVERGNMGALVALCGALGGAALIYAGGSAGEGPSYWNNVFSAGLAVSGFFALWLMLELAGGVSRSITEDRDLASGLRLCGFLIAMGLLLGRAVAGDWHSETATVHDFIRDGWPAVILWAIAAACEIMARPNRRRPFPAWTTLGLLPALLYLMLSGAWLRHLGAWEGMRR